MAKTFVVVGGGQAGGQAIQTLLDESPDSRIVLVGEEALVPHERPPLSKEVLSGEKDPDCTFLKPEAFYRERGVELRLGTRATAIDRARRHVDLSGESIGYDKLLLATGARVRRLNVPGENLPGIFYLRTVQDSLAIRENLKSGATLVVVGGGFIGLEAAAAARTRGCRVVVLEMQPTLLNRVVAPEIGKIYEDLHRSRGVEVRTGVVVSGFSGAGRVERVMCSDGTTILADTVVIGIGIVPNTELAREAGLAVDNGIVVDEYGQTSEGDIFAAGDVTNHPNPLLGKRLRLESWQNAQNQAIAAARSMLGKPTPYAEVPWFWSDQYDVNLQMLGIPDQWDRVVLRGDVGQLKFSAFYLTGDVVVGASAINSAKDIRPARQLIAQKRSVDPGALANPNVPLKALVGS